MNVTRVRVRLRSSWRLAAVVAGILVLAPFLTAQSPSSTRFRVVLLGTGNPRPSIDRFGPSILVQAGGQSLLFDAGRGSLQRLAQVGNVSPQVLFLTHLHSDHVVGIPDLYLTDWLLNKRAAPFRVRGPLGTAAMMGHLHDAFAVDIGFRISDDKSPAEGAKIDADEITQGVVYESNGLRVTAFDVDHRPVQPAFGYRVDFGGHSVVLSGDTRFSDNLIRHSVGTDLLIHEVAAIKGQTQATSTVLAHHTTPEQAGEVFTKTHPRLAVYSHIVGDSSDEQLLEATRKTYDGPLMVGSDLMAFDIGSSIEVSTLK